MSRARAVTIEFASPEAAEHFALWLCESGEQEYWEWMRLREEEDERADITAREFKYHVGKRFQWARIRTVCGRISE